MLVPAAAPGTDGIRSTRLRGQGPCAVAGRDIPAHLADASHRRPPQYPSVRSPRATDALLNTAQCAVREPTCSQCPGFKINFPSSANRTLVTYRPGIVKSPDATGSNSAGLARLIPNASRAPVACAINFPPCAVTRTVTNSLNT